MNPLPSILTALLVASLLSSCGVSYHLRRANHHLKMADLKGANSKVDTLYLEREIIVPTVKYDTVLAYKTLHDTTVIVKNGIITKIKVDTVTKKLYVAVDCPPDTLVVRVPVAVTKTIETDFPWGWVVIAFCVGGAIGLFVARK